MSTDPKRFSTLAARAALKGIEVRSLRNDAEHWTFVVTVGAFTRELPTLDQVEAWLGRLASSSLTTTKAVGESDA